MRHWSILHFNSALEEVEDLLDLLGANVAHRHLLLSLRESTWLLLLRELAVVGMLALTHDIGTLGLRSHTIARWDLCEAHLLLRHLLVVAHVRLLPILRLLIRSHFVLLLTNLIYSQTMQSKKSMGCVFKHLLRIVLLWLS